METSVFAACLLRKNKSNRLAIGKVNNIIDNSEQWAAITAQASVRFLCTMLGVMGAVPYDMMRIVLQDDTKD